MGMKELRELALAYRLAAIKDIKDIETALKEFYREMDPQQKDSVAFKEFSVYMENLGLPELCTEEFFSKLKGDEKSDNLNEMDVVTLFYIIYGQLPFCDGPCKKLIEGTSYFICVECYLDDHKIDKEESFNLCTTCYNDGKYEHHHHNFLDQNLLLRHLRKEYVKNHSKKPEADCSTPSATTHDKVVQNDKPVADSSTPSAATHDKVVQDDQPVADSSTPSATTHDKVVQDDQNLQRVTYSSAASATKRLVADNSSKPSAYQLDAGSSSQSANQYLAESSTQSENDQALVLVRRRPQNKHVELFHIIMALLNTGLATGAALGCSIM